MILPSPRGVQHRVAQHVLATVFFSFFFSKGLFLFITRRISLCPFQSLNTSPCFYGPAIFSWRVLRCTRGTLCNLCCLPRLMWRGRRGVSPFFTDRILRSIFLSFSLSLALSLAWCIDLKAFKSSWFGVYALPGQLLRAESQGRGETLKSTLLDV